MEYAQDGIRVNCVNPGYITTPMTKETMEARGDEILAKVPMHRMGTPEEIAEAVVWMCSDKASFMTGSDVLVDGARAAEVVVAPDLLQQLGAGEHPARVLGEELEELELLERQVERARTDRGGVRRVVHHDPDRQHQLVGQPGRVEPSSCSTVHWL